ncbi:hypothetical protein U1Q18_004520, partial [Sarracenia purpurea var. burkii]
RTDNEVKNFWNSHLKKRFFGMNHNPQSSTQTSSYNSTDTKSKPPSSSHMAQWESARVEAEARLSMDSFLNPPSTVKTDCDYFLRLWNSEVGESFRKINQQDGRESQSPTSQASSSTKVGSGSGVTMQAGAPGTSSPTEKKCMEYKSSNSDSYELDNDSSDSALKLLLDFPSDDDMDDMGFLQEPTDDVSIFPKQ